LNISGIVIIFKQHLANLLTLLYSLNIQYSRAVGGDKKTQPLKEKE